MSVSVIVPTHNDDGTITQLLERLAGEPCVTEIIVIASGCDPPNLSSIKATAGAHPRRVRLYVEPERTGKAAAVNFGLSRCTGSAVVIVSGDVLPTSQSTERLVAALAEPGVGMVGARPVPGNSPSSTVGMAVRLLWSMHHRLALRRPKLGEMVALRREAAAALPRTSVDEACFQARIEAAGWGLRYVPGARVLNWGPRSARDFIAQRRQVHTGHLLLKRRESYVVPSLRIPLLLGVAIAELPRSLREFRKLTAMAAAGSMELSARILARVDYLRGRERYVWDIIKSAKSPAIGSSKLDDCRI